MEQQNTKFKKKMVVVNDCRFQKRKYKKLKKKGGR